MPQRNLQWVGPVPNANQKARIRRCILEYTSEMKEKYDIFGTTHHFMNRNEPNIPIKYGQRMFLAIFRDDFVIVCEDNTLNIKVLIDLWDCIPVEFTEMQFANDFEVYVKNY